MSNFWEWSKDVSFVNRFIFPSPKPPSYNKDSFPDELLFVPPKEKLYKYYKQFKLEQRNKNKGIPNSKYDINSPKYFSSNSKLKSETQNTQNHSKNEHKQQYCDADSIPCIYIERKYRLSAATHLLLYLHGNAEDLGKCYPIIDYIRMKLQCNILAPEYPGYGVSNGDPCETSVAEMVQNVYEFAISPYGLSVPPSRIIIYGFSIGSAAALSTTNFTLRKVYIPNEYGLLNKSEQVRKHKTNSSISTRNEIDFDESKYEIKSDVPLLNYTANNSPNNTPNQYFLSTFLKRVPHKQREHRLLFGDENSHFYTSEMDSDLSGDPFERLPLASLLNILRKGNIEYPTSVNKKELLSVARRHGLIPPLLSCKKANIIRKYSLIIIVCPFASISQVVADKIGVFASYLLSERFKNIEAVKKVHGPLLIIHGKDDSIIPYQHSIEIHKTAQACDIQPTHIELLEGCDHNTMDLRKITNVINKFFKHQFNLCKSSYSAAAANGNESVGHSAMPYPKTSHNNGRVITEFRVTVPSYAWLKPERAAQELTDEDKHRLRKKQESDDEEYAFNLFMKQLLAHENMQNASASHLHAHQTQKLGKFFGDSNTEQSNTETETVNSVSAVMDGMDMSGNGDNEPEYSLSHALRLPTHEIILPPDSSGD